MTERAESIPTGAHWGVYDVLVADGRVVGSRPWADDPDPAPLHAALPGTVYHPTRIARPMVRAGYHNAGPESDTAGRGAEPFVPVSWDRALELVAGELEPRQTRPRQRGDLRRQLRLGELGQDPPPEAP